jgi:hypothetical protein
MTGKNELCSLARSLVYVEQYRLTRVSYYGITLAAHGLEELFPVVLLCQYLVLAGNRFGFYILTYLEYNTVVALCNFFGSGGKQFLVLRTYLVYNIVVPLCQFFGCGGK